MTSRSQSLIALALALSVLVILVSPFAASELTTLRSPQKIRPQVVSLPLSLYAPLSAWLVVPVHPAWEAEAQLVLPGADVVDVTCARLC